MDGQPAPLVRAVLENGGLNYYEFTLTLADSKTVRAVDVLLYNTGERLSQSVGSAARGLMKTGAIPTVDLDAVNDNVTAHIAAGEGRQAMAIINDLPDSLQHVMAVELMRLNAAEAIGTDEHTRALSDYAVRHPGSAALDMLSIDAYFANGQWDKLLASIDSLSNRVGGDSYLDGFRAKVLANSGASAEAIAAANAVLAGNPSDENAWDALLESLAQTGDYAAVVTGLGNMERALRIEVSPAALAEIENYAAFCASPVGKAWAASRAEEE